MDYTAIGDTVNTAARLESNAKAGEILISEAVYEAVKDRINAEYVDSFLFKGKKEMIKTYKVLGRK
jgi:adenylate cyclase